MSRLESEHRRRHVRTAMAERLPPWGVLVLESHHADDFRMRPRTHAFLKIVFILAGEGRFDVGDQSFDFSAGDIVVVPSGATNCIFDGESTPVSLYAGCIDDRVIGCHKGVSSALQTRHLIGPDRITTSIAATLRRMMFVQDRGSPTCGVDMLIDAWRLVRNAMSLDAAGVPTRSSEPRRPSESEDASIVRQYVDDLATSFLEATTIDAAADSLKISRRTFTDLFRQTTGMTWLVYVRTLAIRYAAGLLRNTDLPITSVAFESGFADLSTFYRRFASVMGSSPAAYREANQSTSPIDDSCSGKPSLG